MPEVPKGPSNKSEVPNSEIPLNQLLLQVERTIGKEMSEIVVRPFLNGLLMMGQKRRTPLVVPVKGQEAPEEVRKSIEAKMFKLMKGN